MFDEIMTRLEHVPPKLLKTLLSGIVWEGTPASPCMALTFDDGPDPDITPPVLDALDDAGMRGTFFLLGERAARHPAVVRDIVGRGHAVGNHGMTHQSLLLASRDVIVSEIVSAQNAITDAAGVAPRFFRPPYGLFNPALVGIAREHSLDMVLWTLLAGDYSDDTADVLLDRIVSFIRRGSIVVLHDTVDGGGRELPGIIDAIGTYLRDKDFGGGTVGELVFDRAMILEDEPDE